MRRKVLPALSPDASAVPPAGISVEFDFEDGRYLRPDQRDGGLAYAPPGVPGGARVPLVVFLHGTNPRGEMHLWFDAAGPREDLRPFFDELDDEGSMPPLLVAAPSQTRDAEHGRDLFQGFDLASFAASTERAFAGSFTIDRSRVVLVGHSGAGCNADGGLLGVAKDPGTPPPLAIVAIDTCLGGEGAEMLAASPASTGVWVYWQTESWARPFDDFRAIFEKNRPPLPAERHVVPVTSPGPDPHNDIVPEALAHALRAIFRPSDP